MTRDEVLAICLNLPGTEETFRFGGEVAVIKVGGKMVSLVPLSGQSGRIPKFGGGRTGECDERT